MSDHILGPSGVPITSERVATIRDLLKDVVRKLQGGSPIDTELDKVRKTGNKRSIAVGLSWEEGSEQVEVFLVDIAPKEKGS